eukprot:1703592-Pleurochrysis_carterae.AAC.2
MHAQPSSTRRGFGGAHGHSTTAHRARCTETSTVAALCTVLLAEIGSHLSCFHTAFRLAVADFYHRS